MQTTAGEGYDDIRDAIRALCAEFPAEYHRKVDEERAYPEAFVDALTKAGWMAALIPEEYGGSGLGLTEASRDHGGDQPLGRQLRRLPRPDVQHEHAGPARLRGAAPELPAEDRDRRAAPAVDGRHRADHRHRHDQDQDDGRPKGDRYVDQRPEGLDQPGPALRPDDPARAHHAARPRSRRSRRACRSSSSTSRRRSASGHDASARSSTWSTTRPTSCSSTTSRSRPRT